MHQDNEVEQTAATEFEPSDLVEYGEARERTQGAGGPGPNVDGGVYTS